MKLSEKQEKIVHATENKIVVIATAAAGKAQPDYTPIPTPSGIRQLDELKIGDYVFNRYGKKEQVVGIFPQGEKEIYEVEFADGRIVECCEEHLWSYDNSRGGLTTKTLKEMYQNGWVKKDNRGHNEYKYRVPNLTNAVDFDEKHLDIPPYVVGCFIGDGCCLERNLTISSNDEFIVNEIAKELNCNYKKLCENNYSWSFFAEDGFIRTKTLFNKYKSNICCYCGEKTIPEDYLFSSKEQRMELLRGLMDTDGCTGDGKNSPRYSTTSKHLAYQVVFLARSLGFNSRIFIHNREDKKSTEYTVNIFTSNEKAHTIFKLPRKREFARGFIEHIQYIKHNFITIKDIRPTGRTTSMRCIMVDDKEHLYLTNDFVVTHNTRVLTERIKYLLDTGVNPKELVAITFTNLAANEIRERVGEKAKDCFIGTVHSYCNFLLISKGIDTRGLIEKEDFDGLFQLIKEHPDCIRKVNHLLLDESQDSNNAQFDFLLDTVQPEHYLFVGDHRQSIYRFNGSAPERLVSLTKDPSVTVYELDENYRNGSEILDFAKMIIRQNGYDYVDRSVTTRDVRGAVKTVEYSPNGIARSIKARGDFKDWFILSRWNKDIPEIASACERAGVPYAIIRKRDFESNKELQEKMEENSVKIMTIHASKGLEAKNVVVIGTSFGRNDYGEETLCINYVAATRARDLLIWTTKHKYQKKTIRSWE